MDGASELVAQGADLLSDSPHSGRARMDAETLLLHVLRRNKAWLLAHGGDSVPARDCERFFNLVERRHRGEPIQYIIGEAEFYGLLFTVTGAVLIPRPETEHLVEKVIELAKGLAEPRIVDVGTGSGAIGVALAHALPAASVTATDVSAPALGVARENARRNQVEGRIRFLRGDLLAPVAGERFDIVISNPPYVPNADRVSIAVEVREYEPALALFAGEDGLDVYRRLIPFAESVLVPGGFIALEIGFSQANAIEALLVAAGFHDVEFTPDLQGIPRVASGRRV